VARTILIVDDDPAIRKALERALASLPHTVRSAADGEEARATIEREPVALVLLDLRMPRLGGMALLRELARDHPDVRVAILTAHGTIEDAVEAMKLGAVDFLQKPFSASEIRALVETVLAREAIDPATAQGYDQLVEAVKKLINAQSFADARDKVREAIAARPDDAPEAYNLLGVLEEMRGRRVEAQAHYRVALEMQADYRPAAENLRRSMKPPEDRGGGLTIE
jgi:DNA-binding NtrC family response regulator